MKRARDFTVIVRVRSRTGAPPIVRTLHGDAIFVNLEGGDTIFVSPQEGHTVTWQLLKGRRKLAPKEGK